MESELQKIDSKLFIPYWDWSLDSQSPEKSEVFDIFGGNGQGLDNCVQDGPFADSNMFYPSKSCLKRKFDGGDTIGAFVAPEILDYMIKSETYEAFRIVLEGSPHGTVHYNIGGDMGSMASPNDPIFWMHHAFVDKIWSEFQEMGENKFKYDDLHGNQMDVEQKLLPWEATVKDMFDMDALCYEYADQGFKETDASGKGIPKPNTDPIKDIPPKNKVNTLDCKKSDEQIVHEMFEPILNTMSEDEIQCANPHDRHQSLKLVMPSTLPQTWLKANNIAFSIVRIIENHL